MPSWGQTVGERLIICEWFELIGCELLHWGHLLWEQNDDPFRDLTIHFPVGIPMTLIMQCFITSLCLLMKLWPIISSHFVLVFTSFASVCCFSRQWCWIIDGMLSWWDFSPCGLGLCCFLLPVVMLCHCMQTPVCICVWLIKSAGVTAEDLLIRQSSFESSLHLDKQKCEKNK